MRRIIPLTGRAPVKIDDSLWPIIAKASTFSGEHECQANTIAWIRVRRHADGRVLVYGCRESGPGGWPVGAAGWRGGELLSDMDSPAIARAMLRMLHGLEGGFCAIGARALVEEAIGSLPAEEI